MGLRRYRHPAAGVPEPARPGQRRGRKVPANGGRGYPTVSAADRCTGRTCPDTRTNGPEWSQPGSNRRPPACKTGALPAELWARSPRIPGKTAFRGIEPDIVFSADFGSFSAGFRPTGERMGLNFSPGEARVSTTPVASRSTCPSTTRLGCLRAGGPVGQSRGWRISGASAHQAARSALPPRSSRCPRAGTRARSSGSRPSPRA
jgi:hypothetical protein